MKTRYHIKILTESKGEYRLMPELPEGEDMPMDEYLTQELIAGYTLQIISATHPGVYGHPHQVHVMTKHDPKAAEGHPTMPAGTAPWHYRIFFEDNYQYWIDNGIDDPVSLDEYLSQESERGYNLTSLVGIQGNQKENDTKEEYFKPKLRVTTEYAG